MRKAFRYGYAALVCAVLAGCGGPQSQPVEQSKAGLTPVPPSPEPIVGLQQKPAVPVTQPAPEAPAPPGDSPTPAAGPTAVPGGGETFDELMTVNRRFDFQPDSPHFFPWKIVRWTADAGQAVRVPSPRGGEGDLCVELTGGDVELRYLVDCGGKPLAGATLQAQIDGVAHAAEQLNLQLKYVRDGEEVWLNAASHPGDGEWHTLTTRAKLPDDVSPGELLLRVFRSGKNKSGEPIQTGGNVYVDNASLAVVRGAAPRQAAAPVQAAAEPAPPGRPAMELLVNNRGFEDEIAGGQILPWEIKRFVDEGGHARRVPAQGGAKGSYALEFTGPDVEIRRSLKLKEGPVRGATVRAQIDGVAHVPGQLVLQVKYVLMNEEKWLGQAVHPGDGQWHSMEVAGSLPSDIDAEGVVFRVFTNSKDADGKPIAATENAMVDNATLLLEPR